MRERGFSSRRGTRFQVSSGTLGNAFWNKNGTRSRRVQNANGMNENACKVISEQCCIS